MNTQVMQQSQAAGDELRSVVVSPEGAALRVRRIDLSDAAKSALTTTEEKLRSASASFRALPPAPK